MANSTQTAVSDGTLVLLDISFDYLFRSEITVYFDSVLTTDWAWVGVSDKQITFDPAVPAGVTVLVKRTTSIAELLHEFSLGAAFTATSLDQDLKQVLHIAQEASESNLSGEFFSDINMHGNRITSVAPAVDPSDVPTLGQLSVYSDDAAASAAAAAASYDAFDDRYLGSKAADPLVNNDGESLIVGALYWNSTLSTLRTWDGSAWVTSPWSAATASADDAAAGSIFTTIQGFITKILSSTGSAIVGFIQSGTGAVARTIQDKGRESVSINDFDGADAGEKLTAALAAHDFVRVPPGAYTSASNVSIAANKRVHAEIPGSTAWTVSADVVGFTMAGAYSELGGLYITASGAHTKNLVEVGTTLVKADRARLERLRIDGAGNDGIQVINGNLGVLRDIQSKNNGRDGINFTEDTADNNAWKMEGYLDVADNTRDGLHLSGSTSVSNANNSRSHSVDLLTTQTNGRYGFYSNSRSNIVTLYTEGNVTEDIYLDTYASGNRISIVEVGGFSTVVDVAPDDNSIETHSMNADYVRGWWSKQYFSGRADKGFRINNDDGTAGYLDFIKTAIRAFSIQADGSDADFVTSLTNANASFANHLAIQGAVYPTTDNVRNSGGSSNRWLNGYYSQIRPGNGSPIWTSGTGTPEGAVTAAIGSLFTRVDGGANTTLYVKESGAGNTGWIAK